MDLTTIILLAFQSDFGYSICRCIEPSVASNDAMQKCEVVTEGDAGLTAPVCMHG